MKYDCDLIQDIMPLYMDEVLSNKSKEIVDEHLSECTKCKDLYKNCTNAKKTPAVKETVERDIGIKRYSRRIRNWRIAIISVVLVTFLSLTASFVSYISFNAPNFISSGIGLIKIMASDTPYVEIQSSPRVIIAQPQDSMDLFLDFVESEGYTYLADEQSGGLCVIEKDGKKENVFFAVNEYYSKWSWE